jgi:large subunit ribosomal protein L15
MDLKTICNKGVRYADRKRIARGPGSGLGKTAGRGHKGWGQRAGARRRPGYEGGQMPIYRRVPKRGFTNARFRTDYTVLNVELLNAFDDGATVDLDAVLAHGLASREAPLFKVLGDGELKKKLVVRAQKFSKSAADKIMAAGGTVIALDEQGRERPYEPPAPKAPAPKKAPVEAQKKGESAKGGAETKKKSDGDKKSGGEKKSGGASGKAEKSDGAGSEPKDKKSKPQGDDKRREDKPRGDES